MASYVAGFSSTWETILSSGPSGPDATIQLLGHFENELMAKKTDKTITSNKGEIVMYQSPDGKAALDVRLDRETVWLNQRQMAELFDKDTDTVGCTSATYTKKAS